MQAQPTVRRPITGAHDRLGLSSPEPAGGPLPVRMVLVAEDEFELRMIERYVRGKGFRVTHAPSSAAAALAEPGDVLVVRLSTDTLAEPVRVARERAGEAAVLALTDDAELAVAAYRAGADIVAQLPIDFDLLCCTVEILAARVSTANILNDDRTGVAP